MTPSDSNLQTLSILWSFLSFSLCAALLAPLAGADDSGAPTRRLPALVRVDATGIHAFIRDPNDASKLYDALKITAVGGGAEARKYLQLGYGGQFLSVDCVSGRAAHCRVDYQETARAPKDYLPLPGFDWSMFKLEAFNRVRVDAALDVAAEEIWDLTNLTLWSKKTVPLSGFRISCRRLIPNPTDHPTMTLPESLDCELAFSKIEI